MNWSAISEEQRARSMTETVDAEKIEEAAVCKAEMPTTKFFQVNFGGKADSMLSDENTRTFCHSLRHFFLIVLLFSQPFRAQKPRRIANFERRNARFE